MSKIYLCLLVLAVIVISSGCASIVSKSQWPVTIKSNIEDTTVIVKNGSGEEIHKATTPTTVILGSKGGYFEAAKYTVEYQKEGYNKGVTDVKTDMNPWYIGNVIFGGAIGLTTVDPLTGAMWKMDENLYVNLTPDPTYDPKSSPVKKASPETVSTANKDSIPNQLKELKELKDSGILTNAEYESRRKVLVDKLELGKDTVN